MNIIPTKTPYLLKKVFSNYVWDIQKSDKTLYLTFDDGPIPEVTPFVLDTLKTYHAKATFFCIGDNIRKHPDIFKRILKENHAIGNHTMHHLKAWKTDLDLYIRDVIACEKEIQKRTSYKSSKLFRPPYGQISRSKLQKIQKLGYSVILWDVLSKDWEKKISPEKCLHNTISNSISGSCIVFHDSQKAFKNMKYALPKVLEHFSEKGYTFDRIAF